MPSSLLEKKTKKRGEDKKNGTSEGDLERCRQVPWGQGGLMGGRLSLRDVVSLNVFVEQNPSSLRIRSRCLLFASLLLLETASNNGCLTEWGT